MSRVHKNYNIHRRNLLDRDDYRDFKQELVEDFHNICGYCGKNFSVLHVQSQIDHFIPKTKYPIYTNKYSNLVLCCKTCNGKKGQDWPSENPTNPITSDGLKGYIDPTDIDFDKNITRQDDGSICGLTESGKYMVKRLDFENRPIKEVYLAWELSDEIDRINELRLNECSYDSIKLNELYFDLNELKTELYRFSKEMK